MSDEKHIFISHIHKDDKHVDGLKDLLSQQGIDAKNGSITSEKFNEASNENYIKYDILAPRITWASCLVVLVTKETKDSDFVNWEIEYAHKNDTRVVAVYVDGATELPEAAQDYADAVVCWDGDSVVDAINGHDCWESPSGSPRPPQPMKHHNC